MRNITLLPNYNHFPKPLTQYLSLFVSSHETGDHNLVTIKQQSHITALLAPSLILIQTNPTQCQPNLICSSQEVRLTRK